MLEVFNNLFMTIAEQMGAAAAEHRATRSTSRSGSTSPARCSTPHGNLVANAPHMPVHLGSMGESIKTVIARNAGTHAPGDVYVLNDPYHGGTHLPDITVVTPVSRGRRRAPILFYVGSRGHHADIGGITPGSMPPFSTRIEEEGVLIDNVLLVERRAPPRGARCCALLAGGEHPARNPQQNLADLKAQIAANEKGVQELRRMVAQFGLDVVQAYMRHVQDNAEESVRRVITRLHDGAFALPLDNGARDHGARSASTPRRAAPRSTSPAPRRSSTNNFNAPSAVCMAAVLYVFRTLVDDDIPLNAGCLKPLRGRSSPRARC